MIKIEYTVGPETVCLEIPVTKIDFKSLTEEQQNDLLRPIVERMIFDKTYGTQIKGIQ